MRRRSFRYSLATAGGVGLREICDSPFQLPNSILSANKVPASANKTDIQGLFRASPCMKENWLQRLYSCRSTGFTE
jgi:hypothetical protein